MTAIVSAAATERLPYRGTQLFVYSVCGVLVITAGLKIVAGFGDAKILDQKDPTLLLPYRVILLAVGALESVVAGYCCVHPARKTSCILILWLASNFLIYRFLTLYDPKLVPCPCLGNLPAMLPLSAGAITALMWFIVSYMLFGSIWCLVKGPFRR